MIRNVLLAGLLAATTTTAFAPAAFAAGPAPAAAPAKAAFNTEDTDLGTLLDNPATKAVLQKHLAELVANDQIEMARGMTLKQIQGFKPEAVSDEALAKIDAELAKIPAKK